MAEEKKNSEPTSNTIGEDFIRFLKEVFDLTGQVDKVRTREEVLSNINFKGLSAFVLIASVFIASIGLNSNSVAVVIGAMLISPLMGPIMGIGYSVAVNDIETLKRSFINFGIMVVISLLTSFIYFFLAPLTTLTEQLRGRIEPTSLDVMIGIFGGLAGIAAFSSKIKNANVIAGVAIATALMPPLCTVGYGLSMGSEFIGYKEYTGFGAALNAFYLFIINSIFIGISTFVFIKINKFPLAKYQNAKQERKTNLIIISIAVLTMIPSGFIFYGIVKEEVFKAQVQKFLNQEVLPSYEHAFININNPIIAQKDSLNYITIATITEKIPAPVIENWNKVLEKKYHLDNTRLLVNQGGLSYGDDELNEKLYSSLISSVEGQIYKKDSIIRRQQLQINRLNSDSIPFQSISRELKSLYPELSYFGYATFNYTNFKEKSIIPSFVLRWENDSIYLNKERRIQDYLKSRLSLDTIQLLHR